MVPKHCVDTSALSQSVKATVYLTLRRDKRAYAQCYRDMAQANPCAATYVLLGEAYMRIQMPEVRSSFQLMAHTGHNHLYSFVQMLFSKNIYSAATVKVRVTVLDRHWLVITPFEVFSSGGHHTTD